MLYTSDHKTYFKREDQDCFESNDPIILPLFDNMHKYDRQWTSEKNNVKKRNNFKKTQKTHANFKDEKENKHFGDRSRMY